jgi:transposase
MAQIHVITGEDRRRRWSDEQKRSIVAAAFAPGASVLDVARRADVNSGQIYRWRQELRGSGVASGFAEVVVAPNLPAVTDGSGAMIEVAAADGSRVRLPGSISPDLAASVIKALVGR